MKGSKDTATSISSKGESHRIYWQQWPSSTTGGPSPSLTSRRDLITSSAAIRISPEGAKAQDVTNLLCETLSLKTPEDDNNNNDDNCHLESWDKVQDAWEQDSLVLVGTLYSLPLHYVCFEHEQHEAIENNQTKQQQGDGVSSMMETSSHSSSSTGGGTVKAPKISRSDPAFHVIKTLSGTDNPIQIRDVMIEHLKQRLEESASIAELSTNNNNNNKKYSKVTHSIAPKLQWYFVPGINHPKSPIPSYIDLDGYSTDLEEEESEEEDNSESDGGILQDETTTSDNQEDSAEHDFDPDNLEKFSVSLLEQNEIARDKAAREECQTGNKSSEGKRQSPEERIFQKERRRYFELSMCQSALQHDCVSGYLLKQSMKDPHVWKRVHCVLTDDHLWYISRVYTKPITTCPHKNSLGEEQEEAPSTKQQQQNGFYSLARHRRLELTSALLIQPSSDRPTAPLYRTPFAFEVIATDGIPHRFRASNPALYRKWTEALSSRIVQSYENSLFEHADLIVRDETVARNKRFMSLAVEPLWEHYKSHLEVNDEDNNNNNNHHHRHVPMDAPTMKILRFGIQVSEFKEQCRHVQAILPAKHPVLAMSTTSSPEQMTENGHGNGEGPGVPTMPTPIRLDLPTQNMIKSAWNEAIRLGSFATKIAMELQEDKGDKAKMPRSLETICQHLEYVITGNFRRSLTESTSKQPPSKSAARNNDNTRQFPPPMDLFDALLTELQAVAASVTKQRRSTGEDSRRSSSGKLGNAAMMNGGH